MAFWMLAGCLMFSRVRAGGKANKVPIDNQRYFSRVRAD